ncbi:hypothetical protein HCY58_10760 [Acinetobacter radioresistens]|uniref:hypothetical protein n=1 Tax=Acinetobacter radioresistens TaxID=40216 RepID=UPI002005A857|nr:hypothetical protein [Acinetobacter radioresistens]MCK4087528.1 hypothetical protein [Acinetobacter radioresistens]
MERIIKIIKDWWNGKDTYEKQNRYDAAFFISPLNKKHWTSEWAHKVLDYIQKNQAWIIPTVVTSLVAIVLARPWTW